MSVQKVKEEKEDPEALWDQLGLQVKEDLKELEVYPDRMELLVLKDKQGIGAP